jgi:hypothetical protein
LAVGTRLGAHVLSGTHEKEETDGTDVGASREAGIVVGCGVGQTENMLDDGDREGLDTVGGRIFTAPALELLLETVVELAQRVETDVVGPQAGERLAHRTDGVRHCCRSKGVTAGGESTIAESGGPHLEGRDGIGLVREERVEVVLRTEVAPQVPMAVRGGGS